MRIRLVTTINAPFKATTQGFDRRLFEYLLPPFSFVKIGKYEGQQLGDIIDLRIGFPFGFPWTVIIKDTWYTGREYGFTDRGLRVPLGIEYWQHIHRVVTRDQLSSFIIDDIEYETANIFLDYLIYLPLLMMFYPRKILYKKYYRNFMKTYKETI